MERSAKANQYALVELIADVGERTRIAAEDILGTRFMERDAVALAPKLVAGVCNAAFNKAKGIMLSVDG